MTDWADWGTSIGTLVLAGATFAALRSSNRSARIAERALLAGLRPLLMPSRPEDPGEHVQFADGRVLEARAGRALVDAQDSVIYLAIPLRNVGSGIAVLRGYDIEAETAEQAAQDPQGAARHRRGDPVPDPAVFAEQQRDLYVPPGNLGFWQAALRDPGSKRYQRTEEAIRTAGRITVVTALHRPRGRPARHHQVRTAPRRRPALALRRDTPLEPRPSGQPAAEMSG